MLRPSRTPLLLAMIATVVAWGAWLATIVSTDPSATGAVGRVLFHATLFAAVAGTATLVGLLVRRHAPDQEHMVGIVVRQGAIVGIAVTTAVFLQSQRLLTWWNLTALILALTTLELFWITLRRHTRTHG